MKKISFLLVLSGLSLAAISQTLYVPSGTSGIAPSSNGNVGIGTASPSAQLEVNQDFVFGSNISNLPGRLSGFNNTTNPEITSLVAGSAGGTLVETAGYGQFVIGVRDNGGNDGFHILSTSQSYTGQQNGTPSPYSKLIASFLANGNVGIGTNTPKSQLEVYKDFSFGSYKTTIPGRMTIYDNNTNPQIPAIVAGSTGGILMESSGYGQFVIGLRDNGVSDGFHILSTSQSYNGEQNGSPAPYNKLIVSFLANGKVGIGTNNPSAKLEVDGNITSEEVKVQVVNPPDYVFSPDYSLRSLDETKAYITENKHLPEIPSAKEMEANGIELGEMNMLLLKKIEELTLHLIKQSEENKKQAEQITMLQKELQQLKSPK